MHRCSVCNETLKLDQSLIDQYPEWRVLAAGGKAGNVKCIPSTSKDNLTAFGNAQRNVWSGSGDDVQLLDAVHNADAAPAVGGNLGHATAMIGNLFDIICSEAVAVDYPMCTECADKLQDFMDQQLHQLEEDCKEYRNLLRQLDQGAERPSVSTAGTVDNLDFNTLKAELLKLQGEEAGLQAELARLEAEEAELENQLLVEETEVKKVTEEEEKLWKTYRDLSRQVFEISSEEQSVQNQLRYANSQLEKLKKSNVFNLTFHIWHSGHFGTINGFRLGRLPNEVVDWSEINTAWGQTVLLLYSLARKINMKFSRFELVPYGSHSCVRCVEENGKELPLYCSGGYKFFWDTKFDSAIVAFLDCLQQFKEEIDKFGEFRLPYRMLKDKIEDNGSEYSVKVQFNSEERWTKAMKCMLTNLKWALACVASL